MFLHQLLTRSFDFMQMIKPTAIISTALILLSILLLFTKGLALGVDFTGGILMEVELTKPTNLETLRKHFESTEFDDGIIQSLSTSNQFLLRMSKGDGSSSESIAKIKHVLSSYDAEIIYRKVDFVGPKVSQELLLNGLIALALALLCVFIYVAFRFEIWFGTGAIIALIHDLVLCLGFFSLVGLEFNVSSVAALLTIIGYSINDTVVIYDRIRENKRKYKKASLNETINRSINDNLVRTLMTSFSTLLALLALIFLGGANLYSFSVATAFGVIIGTYSSIYIASSILHLSAQKPHLSS